MDEVVRQFARRAGEGDVLAARSLLVLLERIQAGAARQSEVDASGHCTTCAGYGQLIFFAADDKTLVVWKPMCEDEVIPCFACGGIRTVERCSPKTKFGQFSKRSHEFFVGNYHGTFLRFEADLAAHWGSRDRLNQSTLEEVLERTSTWYFDPPTGVGPKKLEILAQIRNEIRNEVRDVTGESAKT